MDTDRTIAHLRAELTAALEVARGRVGPNVTYHQMMTNLTKSALQLLDTAEEQGAELAIRVAQHALDEWHALTVPARSSG